MSNYAVITQNDSSAWDDVKGDLYHYPSTYKSILAPGCKIVYYKGRITDKAF
jgi:putative restriction endonuclease